MAEQLLPAGFLQYKPEQVNSMINFIFWVVVGLIIVGVVGYILYRFFKKRSYVINVTIHKQVGDMIVKEEDWAKKIYTPEGKYVYHYFYLNKRSPIIEDKYLKIVKKPWLFGFRVNTFVGFDAYMKDGKIAPMMTNKRYDEQGNLVDVIILGIDYDDFNFIVAEVDSYFMRKKKEDRFMQLAPYAMFLLVIIAFVVGMIFYTKHIETMASIWLENVKTSTASIIDKIGTLQVIPQK